MSLRSYEEMFPQPARRKVTDEQAGVMGAFEAHSKGKPGMAGITAAFKASKARVKARDRMEKNGGSYAGLAFCRADTLARTAINANREKFYVV